MSSLQEPDVKPNCCGQQAKWVCQSPTLHYFYCEKCKKEVLTTEGAAPAPPVDKDAILASYDFGGGSVWHRDMRGVPLKIGDVLQHPFNPATPRLTIVDLLEDGWVFVSGQSPTLGRHLGAADPRECIKVNF